MITYRFALRIVLPAIMSALGLAGPLLAADARIQAGDKIMTAHDATPVKSGETTLLTLGQGVELTAEATRGDWVKVTVDGNGEKTTGWIHARHLTRAGSSTDRMAANTHLRRAIDLLNRGDLDGAMERLNHAIRLDPTHAEAYQERGKIWLRKNEPDRGIADCTEAIRLLPDVAAAYVIRGAAWSQKGEFDKTLADCAEAIRLDSKLAIAYAVRAEATHDRGFAVAADSTGALTLTSEEWEKGCNEVLDKAIADYTQAIRLDPSMATFYVMRGQAWQEKRDFDKAVADYTKCLSLDPKNAAVYAARARARAETGEFDKAIADCTQAIRLDPQLAEAYLWRRMSRHAKGDRAGATADLAEAKRNCHEAIQAGYSSWLRAGTRTLVDVNGVMFDVAAAGGDSVTVTNSPFTRFEALKLRVVRGETWRIDLGTASIELETTGSGEDAPLSLSINGAPHGEVQRGSYVMVNEAWDVTVDGEARRPPDPTDARGFWARADAERQRGEYDKAIADSTEAIRLDPEYADAYANRGEAWRQKGELEKALSDFVQTLRLDPKHAWTYVNRAAVHDAQGNLDQAIEDYTQAIELDENYAWAYANRGDAWRKKGELEKALGDFAEALRLDPELAWAYGSRGAVHEAQGNLDQAIQDYSQAIELDENYAWAYANRGDAWRKKSECDKALADCTEAVRLDPQFAWAYSIRGLIHAEKGDLDQAIADHTESIRLDPTYAWAFKSRGMAHARNKDRDAAIRDFREALRLAPQDPGLCNGIAWFLATCPEADVRDGELALQFAAKAVELRRDADSLDTLAAAYAENGEFDKAVDTETQALEEAAKADASFDPTEYRDRLKLYQQNEPYREKNAP